MFVPILPAKLHHFFDAPVPFLVGVTVLDEAWKQRTHDAVFVYLAEDRIEAWNLIDKDAAMPAAGQLRQALKPFFPRHQAALGKPGVDMAEALSCLKPFGKMGAHEHTGTKENPHFPSVKPQPPPHF